MNSLKTFFVITTIANTNGVWNHLAGQRVYLADDPSGWTESFIKAKDFETEKHAENYIQNIIPKSMCTMIDSDNNENLDRPACMYIVFGFDKIECSLEIVKVSISIDSIPDGIIKERSIYDKSFKDFLTDPEIPALEESEFEIFYCDGDGYGMLFDRSEISKYQLNYFINKEEPIKIDKEDFEKHNIPFSVLKERERFNYVGPAQIIYRRVKFD